MTPDNPDLVTDYAGYALASAGLLSMAWSYWTTRRLRNAQALAAESDATGKTGLIEALEARIAASEARQSAQDTRIQELEGRIAVEIDLRLKGAEENHKLRLRVTELEFAIRQMGGVVPVGAS